MSSNSRTVRSEVLKAQDTNGDEAGRPQTSANTSLRRSASVPDLSSSKRPPSLVEFKTVGRLSLATLFERSVDIWTENVEKIVRHTTDVRHRVQGKDADERSQRWRSLARDLDNTLFRMRLWAQDMGRSQARPGRMQYLDVYVLLDALEQVPELDQGKLLAGQLARTCRQLYHTLPFMNLLIVDRQKGSPPPDEWLVISKHFSAAVDQLVDHGLSLNVVIDLASREKGISIAPSHRPHMVLSFDGGGIRSLSSLFILRAIMDNMNEILKHQQDPLLLDGDLRPRDVFDYICGSSSGGLVAIMLGRLHMTVDQCIQALKEYSEKIFKHPRISWRLLGLLSPRPKYSTRSLLKAVEVIVGEFDPTTSEQQWRKDVFVLPGDRCKTGVFAMRTNNVRGGFYHRYLLRSYRRESDIAENGTETDIERSEYHRRRTRHRGSEESSYDSRRRGNPKSEAFSDDGKEDLLIWQVVRATASSPILFPPMIIDGATISDGAMIRLNNPSSAVIEEVKALGSEGHNISLISLGAGHRMLDEDDVRPSQLTSSWVIPYALRQLAEAVTSPDPVHHDVRRMHRRGELGAYWRLSAYMNGLPRLDQLKIKVQGRSCNTFDYVETQTKAYLKTEKVSKQVTECAEELISKRRARL